MLELILQYFDFFFVINLSYQHKNITFKYKTEDAADITGKPCPWDPW